MCIVRIPAAAGITSTLTWNHLNIRAAHKNQPLFTDEGAFSCREMARSARHSSRSPAVPVPLHTDEIQKTETGARRDEWGRGEPPSPSGPVFPAGGD